jgi:MoxR-like ATPase
MSKATELYQALSNEVGSVLIGNEDTVEGMTIALLTGGHVLLQGVPGVAKTTAARLFTNAVGLDFRRIQMTPDVLPSDVTGTEVYHQHSGEFEIRRGPVFANVVMADEINRASPKTQSALLEAMQERQVTIDGEVLTLPSPFLLIATQNPIEMEGTYELPRAQRDRFQQLLVVDLPERTDEFELLNRFDTDDALGPDSIFQVVSEREVMEAQAEVQSVYVSDEIKHYILDIVAATRNNPDIEYGVSPRATLAFLRCGKALAALDGRDYVIPDDIKELAPRVLSHRISLTPDAELSGLSVTDVVADVLESVPEPGAKTPALEDISADGTGAQSH